MTYWGEPRRRRPKHRKKKIPPVADAKGSSAHLILNPASGSAAALLRSLTRAARELGIRVRVLEPGEDAKHAALEAADAGAQVLAVAGGDGSVASVAGVAVERELPFVVVPTGTLNHFARDLGLDLARPLRALDAFASDHHERRVDVGQINGRPFINNVSLGFTPRCWETRATGQTSCAWRRRNSRPSTPTRRSDGRCVSRHPTRLHSRASSPWSSRTTRTNSHGGTGSATASAWTPGTLQVSVLDASTLDELERLLAGTLLGAIGVPPCFTPLDV
jgi:hypothetical protein